MARLIDADELEGRIASIARLARSDAQKALLGRVLYIIDHMPTTPAPQWISVENELPKLPDGDWCSVMVITAKIGDSHSYPMIYERAIVRGKRVERWKYYWDKIADELPDYWMPLPEPPKERYKCRYADDNGVCSKLSGNGEIIYCIEGPCPYDMPEEVRNE